MNPSFRNIFLLFFVLCPIILFSQKSEKKYSEYSYTEFFEMIENEKDSVFKLEDAYIYFDITSDKEFISLQDTLTKKEHFKKFKIQNKIHHEIHLKNVQFEIANKDLMDSTLIISKYVGLQNLEFTKPVYLENVASFIFQNIVFNELITIKYSNNINEKLKYFNTPWISDLNLLSNCNFKNGLAIYDNNEDSLTNIYLHIYNSQISSNESVSNNLNFNSSLEVQLNWFSKFELINTHISKNGRSMISISDTTQSLFQNNIFDDSLILFTDDFSGTSSVSNKETTIINNQFSSYLFLRIVEFSNNNLTLDYNQFDNNVFSYFILNYFNDIHDQSETNFKNDESFTNKNIDYYLNHALIENDFVYKAEQKFKANLHQMYKQEFDTEFANSVYVEIKDLETKRSEILYQQDKNFDTFFTWKINQFLKIFSAYGTKPSRAIIMSLYVILFFAFIYLLFPNSWDTLGKKRLMHRFDFFQKYLRKKEGMHTLYLEEHEKEINSYEDFKTKIEKAEMELPKFFVSWSKPLYNASMFSSKMTSGLLKKTDVLKGKWQDLSPKQKRWKNLQIGFLLTLGLLFDFTIKVLNALMLSINTFTTLGFGEIPIKGIPRYLAIIQGFIGWFMLTIFSVSLISQLLN